MKKELIEKFWFNLVNDIQRNRITLPTLPEISLKARKLLDNRKTNVKQVAKVISADVVLTTKVLRIVNSPLYRTRTQIDDIQSAIVRLGHANVRSLVTSVAMEQLYQLKQSASIKKQLAIKWKHSVHVAALSHIIAKKYTLLKPDEALLAGLIHDIGTLPILEYADMIPELNDDVKTLNTIVAILHTKVGELILKTWNFPEELISVVAEHENLKRDKNTAPDYTDVVMVANLLSYIGTNHPYTKLNWTEIPAFKKLSLTPDESINAIKNAKEEITEIREMFFN